VGVCALFLVKWPRFLSLVEVVFCIGVGLCPYSGLRKEGGLWLVGL